MLKSSISGVNKAQPSPERLSIQLNYMERRYEEALTKVLEQNREILTSVASIQNELKSLRNKVESLEIAAQEEPLPRTNGHGNNGLGSRTPDQRSNGSPAGGMMGGHMPPYGNPGFYNPFAMYNPYPMMPMPDPSSYLMNPAMQYAALYGALNPAAAAAAAGMGVGIGSVGHPTAESTPQHQQNFANLSNGSSNLSFANLPGVMQTPEPARLADTVKSSLVITPVVSTPAPAAPKPDVSSGFSFSINNPPVTSVVTTAKIAPVSTTQITPPKTTSVPVTSVPATVKTTTIANEVNNATKTSVSKPFTFTFGGTSFATTTTASTPPTQAKPILTATSTFSNKSALAPAKQADEKAQPKKDEAPKFGGFSSSVDFSALSSKMPSFGDLSQMKPAVNPFGNSPFTIDSKPMFGGTASADQSDGNSPSAKAHEEGEDDFVPTAEFAPVIPLPPLVETKRGDENENVMFQHRAKLLRFIKGSGGGAGEWKERGIGDIKILQAKDNEKKIRVVMWREKVHKIACNHWITKDIKVTNYQGSPKNLMWTAFDFAEAEDGPKSEIFVCRFGQEEKAKEFKIQMEMAISLVDASPTTPVKSDSTPPAKEEARPVVNSNVPISQLFKKPEGNWNCEVCYTENKKESLLCAACQEPNPNPAVCSVEPKPVAAVAAAPKFSFGFGNPAAIPAPDTATKTVDQKSEPLKPPSFSFGPSTAKPELTPTSTKPTATPANTENKASFNFGFGSTATMGKTAGEPSGIFTLKSNTALVQASPGSIFGQAEKNDAKKDSTTPFFDFSKKSSDMPSFASLATTPTVKPFSGNSLFGSGAVAPVFGSITPQTGFGGANSTTPSNELKTNEEGDDEFVPTAEFAPVVPLPPLVETKRGDENENVMFSHRAKLLRFVKSAGGTGEWKERGVGDIKILQTKDNEKKIRVVMWREKVHKIACNHWITKDIKVTNYQGNPKNLMWTAMDFAEAEEGPKSEIFVCRFGQEEKGQEFKQAFEKAITMVETGGVAGGFSPPSKAATTKEANPAPANSLAAFCKKTEGEWSCSACYCSNKKESSACVSCATPRPGSKSIPSAKPDSPSDLADKVKSLKLPADFYNDSNGVPHRMEGPSCRGCDPDKFDFKALDGREVPVFDDIPKPIRGEVTPPRQSELKQLLTKPSLVSPVTPVPANSSSDSLSSFSFNLPGGASVFTTSAAPSSEARSAAPTFSFTPNFASQVNPSEASSLFSSGLSNPRVDSNVPTTVTSLSNRLNQNGGDDDDNGDEDEEDEDEEDAMFIGDGHAYFKKQEGDFEDYGEGQVKILYDGDRYCARFLFLGNDDEDCFIDHIVALETNIASSGTNTYEWDCVSYTDEETVKGRVKLVLPDQQSFDQFATAMYDSVEIAQQAEITEADLERDGDNDE